MTKRDSIPDATIRRVAVALIGALLTAGVAAAQSGSAKPSNDGGGARVGLGKVDRDVVSSMRSARRTSVLLLGRSQLLVGPRAFDDFVASHSARDRRQLRTQVIERLKKIAATEQMVLRRELKLPTDTRPLWIVNGLLARLTADEILRAAAHPRVKFIYAAGRLAPMFDEPPGRVSDVVERSPPPPFTIEGKRVPWNLERLGARRVWEELGITGEGIVIAGLDGGVNYTHPDLRSRIWVNPGEIANNGRDDDANGYTDDFYGFDFLRGAAEVRRKDIGGDHGTFTAGIAVGDGSAGIVTGVAPRARAMALVGQFGAAIHASALAYEYALDQGADIVNMSFSQPGLGNLRGVWRLMSDHAVCAGLVLVSGAGNFRETARIPEQLRIPEGIPSVIGVGGVDRDLEVAAFSSLGPVEWATVEFYGDHVFPPGLTKPDIVTFPGPKFPLLHPKSEGYIELNTEVAGNSFSGPHAAGVAALVLSANPALPAWEVGEILELTATDIGAPGKDNRTGAGLVNAFAAVREAQRRGAARAVDNAHP